MRSQSHKLLSPHNMKLLNPTSNTRICQLAAPSYLAIHDSHSNIWHKLLLQKVSNTYCSFVVWDPSDLHSKKTTEIWFRYNFTIRLCLEVGDISILHVWRNCAHHALCDLSILWHRISLAPWNIATYGIKTQKQPRLRYTSEISVWSVSSALRLNGKWSQYTSFTYPGIQ